MEQQSIKANQCLTFVLFPSINVMTSQMFSNLLQRENICCVNIIAALNAGGDVNSLQKWHISAIVFYPRFQHSSIVCFIFEKELKRDIKKHLSLHPLLPASSSTCVTWLRNKVVLKTGNNRRDNQQIWWRHKGPKTKQNMSLRWEVIRRRKVNVIEIKFKVNFAEYASLKKDNENAAYYQLLNTNFNKHLFQMNLRRSHQWPPPLQQLLLQPPL